MAFLQAYGFDGPIYEADWSRLAALLGHQYTVAPGSWKVTAVANERAVRISSGRAQGSGIISQTDAIETVELPTPTAAGQWHLIVCHRNWNPDPIDEVPEAFTSLPGPTTTASIPTRTPQVWPASYRSDPGVTDDQPLAWVWVPRDTAQLVVFDLRRFATPAMPAPGVSMLVDRGYQAGPIENPKTGLYSTLAFLDVTVPDPTSVEIVANAEWSAPANAAGQFDLWLGDTSSDSRLTPIDSCYSHNLGQPSARLMLRQSARVVLAPGTTRIYLRASTDSGSSSGRSFQFINLLIWRA